MADKAQLQEAIKTQGEVVRKLKSEKASKEQVSMSSKAFFKLNEGTHGVTNGCLLYLSYEKTGDHKCHKGPICMAGYELF